MFLLSLLAGPDPIGQALLWAVALMLGLSLATREI
jgi:hypothetical protein